MASIEKTLLNRTLIVSINDGVTDSGKTKVKNRSFNNINADATDTALYNTAKALGGLMSQPINKISFSDKNLLQEKESD